VYSCVPLASAELLFNNYTPEIDPVTSGPGSYTVGTEFTVGAQAVAVTKLGVFAGTGVFQDTPVGIWSVSNQSLVASAVITSNAAANVVRIQDWYMVPQTPRSHLSLNPPSGRC